MSREETAESAPHGRRRRRVIFGAAGGALVLLALLAAGYLYAHHAHSMPPPIWTTADLRELPPEEDNGWTLLHARGLHFYAEDEDGLIFGDGAPMVPSESRARVLADDLARDEDARRELSAQGRFADACLPGELGCRELSVHGLARQRGLAMIVGARLDDWSRVTEEAGALSRQGSDFAATCRTMASCLVAAKGLETLMIAAETVGTIALAGESPSTEALGGLVELLRDTPTPSVDVGGPIVSEYLIYRTVLGRLEAKAELLVDLADTAHRMDEMYVATHAFAVDPTRGPPPPPAPRSHPLWWVYNARGKLFLDTLSWSLEASMGFIARYRDTLVDIDDRRGSALVALERAIARAEARANRAVEPDTTIE